MLKKKECKVCLNNFWLESEERFCCNEGKKQALAVFLGKGGNKTKYAKIIAEKICENPDESKRIPPKIKELFDQISIFLGGIV